MGVRKLLVIFSADLQLYNLGGLVYDLVLGLQVNKDIDFVRTTASEICVYIGFSIANRVSFFFQRRTPPAVSIVVIIMCSLFVNLILLS